MATRDQALFLQRRFGTWTAARFLFNFGWPVDAAVKLLARRSS